jgi:hypothetical protein
MFELSFQKERLLMRLALGTESYWANTAHFLFHGAFASVLFAVSCWLQNNKTTKKQHQIHTAQLNKNSTCSGERLGVALFLRRARCRVMLINNQKTMSVGVHHLTPMDKTRLVAPPPLAIFISLPLWCIV